MGNFAALFLGIVIGTVGMLIGILLKSSIETWIRWLAFDVICKHKNLLIQDNTCPRCNGKGYIWIEVGDDELNKEICPECLDNEKKVVYTK